VRRVRFFLGLPSHPAPSSFLCLPAFAFGHNRL
jgi:hypothetical protein